MLRIITDIFVTLFGLGIVGSAIVVIVTFIEDIRELKPDKESAAERKIDVAEIAK
ncbi:MAG TPA: hypothetical protein VFU50_20705 [Terriglobales bacterium]|nr:hypothetical protein [Terriglobales bacterium]